MAFIVFEGLDGSGKSTLIRGLAEELKSRGIEFVLTREPGGTPLGEEIRQLLLRTEGEAPTPLCELFLYQAIRAQHVEKKILPELKKGRWVISDRYSASTWAFQAGGRQIEDAMIEKLNEFATGDCQPHLWVLLDLTTEEANRRMNLRGPDNKDRFEVEKHPFHERVRKKYLEIAKKQPNWFCLPSSDTPEALKEKLIAKLDELGFFTDTQRANTPHTTRKSAEDTPASWQTQPTAEEKP